MSEMQVSLDLGKDHAGFISSAPLAPQVLGGRLKIVAAFVPLPLCI